MPPSTHLNQKQRLWLAVSGLALTSLVAFAFTPPFIDPEWRSIVMAGYRNVCHQLPSRSFEINGAQVALCHRCVGIWSAVPVAVAFFGLLRRWDRALGPRPAAIIALSLVPLGIDWTLDAVGLWTNSPASRLSTGAVFGLVAGYYLSRAIVNGAGRNALPAVPSPAQETAEDP